MNENLLQKQQVVAEIKDKFSRAKSIVFVDYKGTNVAQVTDLRNNIRKANADYKVYKNKLMLRALNEMGIENVEGYFEGTTAVAISYDDEVLPANLIAKAGEENKNLKVKFGIVNGKVVDSDYVNTLARSPSREVLISKLLGSMQSPITNLARVLNQIAEKGDAA